MTDDEDRVEKSIKDKWATRTASTLKNGCQRILRLHPLQCVQNRLRDGLSLGFSLIQSSILNLHLVNPLRFVRLWQLWLPPRPRKSGNLGPSPFSSTYSWPECLIEKSNSTLLSLVPRKVLFHPTRTNCHAPNKWLQ